MIGDISAYHTPSEQVARQMDTTAMSLGFDYVFSNLVVSGKSNELERMLSELYKMVQARNGTIELNRPSKRSSLVDMIANPNKKPCLIVLSRVTVVLQGSDKVEAIYDAIVKKLIDDVRVDCLCIRPANETQLMELINNRSKFSYDLLSIDVSNGNFFQQLGTVVRSIRSGKDEVLIELELSQVFRNSTGSGTEVTNVVNQCRMVLTRMTGIVVSSGAKSAFEMRSPVDLINWAQGVLGLRSVKKNLGILLERVLKKKLVRMNFIT
jgi:RNase P/RNase MRP subunit p30